MVIILTGPDSFRSLQRLQQLRLAFQEKHDSSGLNIVSLDGETTAGPAVRDAAASSGLFADQRMVILDPYPGKKAATKPAELNEILAPLATEKTPIVLIREIIPAPTKKGKAAATGSSLRVAKAKVEQFSLLSVSQSSKWVASEAKRRNALFSPEAIERLVAVAGDDTWRLNHEIDKLITYASERPVTVEDVDVLTVDPVESNVFEFVDAVSQRQVAKALVVLHREIESGTNLNSLVAMLLRHVQHLLAVKSMGSVTAAHAARDIGLHPYVATKTLAQAKVLETEELKRWHDALFQIDGDIKSTPLDAETLLTVFLGRV